jgi:hypothetical protein
MESLSSLFSKKNAASEEVGTEVDLSSLSGETKTRIGPRRRAFAQIDAAFERAEQEGWDLFALRAYIADLEDESKGTGSTSGPKATGRQSFCTGVSRKGNKILLQIASSEEMDLKEEFISLYRFQKKADAIRFIETGDSSHGVRVF